MQRDHAERVAVSQKQIAELGVANPRGVLQHRLKYRLQFARRAGDDLEHLGGRGLLLRSRLLRSSLSSRVFSMAMTACAAKFCTSSICLSVNGRTSWR